MESKVCLWKGPLLKSMEFFLHESNGDLVDKKVRICLSETIDCDFVVENATKTSETGGMESIASGDVMPPTCQLFSRDCLSLKIIQEQIQNCNHILGRHEEKRGEVVKQKAKYPKEGIISFYYTKKDVFLTNSTHYIPIQLKRELMEAFD